MSNKDSYKRKHRYLDNQITKLEKTNSYNRDLILGTYKPTKKFTNGRPAQANNPMKTLYIEYA